MIQRLWSWGPDHKHFMQHCSPLDVFSLRGALEDLSVSPRKLLSCLSTASDLLPRNIQKLVKSMFSRHHASVG